MLTHNATFRKPRFAVALALLCTLACASAALAESSGADIYKSKCQMCHGADLKGNTPGGKMTHTQPLDTPEVIAKTDADLTATTKNGRKKMPAFASKLSDAQIHSVIAYIRTLQKK
jgi:cytochrome c551